MSATERQPEARGDSSADLVAGFLAAIALAAAALSIVWYPGRLGPAAIFVALLACILATGQRRLAAFALGVAGVCWVIGMIVSVTADRPIF